MLKYIFQILLVIIGFLLPFYGNWELGKYFQSLFESNDLGIIIRIVTHVALFAPCIFAGALIVKLISIFLED